MRDLVRSRGLGDVYKRQLRLRPDRNVRAGSRGRLRHVSCSFRVTFLVSRSLQQTMLAVERPSRSDGSARNPARRMPRAESPEPAIGCLVGRLTQVNPDISSPRLPEPRRPAVSEKKQRAFRPVRDERLGFRGTTLLGRSRVIHVGGAAGTRTPYLNTASVALSRMSYSPMTIREAGPLGGLITEATRRWLLDEFDRSAASHQPAARCVRSTAPDRRYARATVSREPANNTERLTTRQTSSSLRG